MKHTIHVQKLNINENKNKQLWEALSWLHGDSHQAWKATQFTKHKQEKIKNTKINTYVVWGNETWKKGDVKVLEIVEVAKCLKYSNHSLINMPKKENRSPKNIQ
jgi:hypothetical protein